MNTATHTLGAAVSPASRAVQLGLAALLGIFVTGFAGMAPISAIHNAAHDYRHSMAFPCH